MFKINDDIAALLKEAKREGSVALHITSPVGNPAVARFFLMKGYKVGYSCIEIDFHPTRWDVSEKGQKILKATGFSPRKTGVKKEDIIKGEEQQWVEILAAVLSVPGVFVTLTPLHI